MSKSDRADQPFNLGGAREGQGQHFKKNRQSTARKDEKSTTHAGAARVHQARAPLQWSTGAVPVGVPALAQTATVGLLHSPGLGERKAEKKNDRENVRKCTQAAGPMQALHSPMHTNARPCTPNAPGMQAQVVIMMQLSKYKVSYVLCF